MFLCLSCSDKFPDDEWNLLYVAVTRAKTSLIITKNIRHILTVAGVGHSPTMHLTFILYASAVILMSTSGHYVFYDILSSLSHKDDTTHEITSVTRFSSDAFWWF